MENNAAMYSVSIKEQSRDFTARERILMKDTSNAVKLDSITDEGAYNITPADYAVLSIHNPKSDNPDYDNIVILGDDGVKYVTGSPSFMKAFFDIATEMSEEDGPFTISAYKLDSKNYKGKKFLTCSIV